MSERGRKIVKNQTSSHAKFHKMPADVFKSDRRFTARRFSLHSHLRLRKSENPHKLEAKSKGNNPNILIIYHNTCQLILSKTYVCDKLTDIELACDVQPGWKWVYVSYELSFKDEQETSEQIKSLFPDLLHSLTTCGSVPTRPALVLTVCISHIITILS